MTNHLPTLLVEFRQASVNLSYTKDRAKEIDNRHVHLTLVGKLYPDPTVRSTLHPEV